MNTAAAVTNMIAGWREQGLTKAELVVKIAEVCLGWPYVWGGYGQNCTVSNRKSYAERGSCPSAESEVIRKTCQVLNGSRSSCDGCKYYPGGTTRFFDCRGFTRWVLAQVGITLKGGGATSQWNDNSNWKIKGKIADMPDDIVCCLFMYNSKNGKMEHTGFCIGHGIVIHCSGEVKYGKTTDRGWTHFAIPNGLEGEAPMPDIKPTLRKGDKGEYVTLLQTKLIQLGYDLEPYGADGSFGKKTQEAVKAFQRDHGLTVDGVVGRNTWAALDSAEPGKQYTVTIPHLNYDRAVALTNQYAGAEMIEERG